MTDNSQADLQLAIKIYKKTYNKIFSLRDAFIASFLMFIINMCFHINVLAYYIGFILCYIIIRILFIRRYLSKLNRSAYMLPEENVIFEKGTVLIHDGELIIFSRINDCMIIQREGFLFVKPYRTSAGDIVRNYIFIIKVSTCEKCEENEERTIPNRKKIRIKYFSVWTIILLLTLFFLLSKLDLYYLQKLAYFITSHGKI